MGETNRAPRFLIRIPRNVGGSLEEVGHRLAALGVTVDGAYGSIPEGAAMVVRGWAAPAARQKAETQLQAEFFPDTAVEPFGSH
jgi:hypothetical protein